MKKIIFKAIFMIVLILSLPLYIPTTIAATRAGLYEAERTYIDYESFAKYNYEFSYQIFPETNINLKIDLLCTEDCGVEQRKTITERTLQAGTPIEEIVSQDISQKQRYDKIELSWESATEQGSKIDSFLDRSDLPDECEESSDGVTCGGIDPEPGQADEEFTDPGTQCLDKADQGKEFVDFMDSGVIRALEAISALLFTIAQIVSFIDSAMILVSGAVGHQGPTADSSCCIIGWFGAGRGICAAVYGFYQEWQQTKSGPILGAVLGIATCACCSNPEASKGSWTSGSPAGVCPLGWAMDSLGGVSALSPLPKEVTGSGTAQFHLSAFDNIYTAVGCLCPVAILFNLRKLKTIYQVNTCCVEESCKKGISTEGCAQQLDEALCMYWEGAIYKSLAKIVASVLAGYMASFLYKKLVESPTMGKISSCLLWVAEAASMPSKWEAIVAGLDWFGNSFEDPSCEDLGVAMDDALDTSYFGANQGIADNTINLGYGFGESAIITSASCEDGKCASPGAPKTSTAPRTTTYKVPDKLPTLYTNGECPLCESAVTRLAANGVFADIHYKVEYTTDPAVMARYEAAGGGGYPLIEFKDGTPAHSGYTYDSVTNLAKTRWGAPIEPKTVTPEPDVDSGILTIGTEIKAPDGFDGKIQSDGQGGVYIYPKGISTKPDDTLQVDKDGKVFMGKTEQKTPSEDVKTVLTRAGYTVKDSKWTNPNLKTTKVVAPTVPDASIPSIFATSTSEAFHGNDKPLEVVYWVKRIDGSSAEDGEIDWDKDIDRSKDTVVPGDLLDPPSDEDLRKEGFVLSKPVSYDRVYLVNGKLWGYRPGSNTPEQIFSGKLGKISNEINLYNVKFNELSILTRTDKENTMIINNDLNKDGNFVQSYNIISYDGEGLATWDNVKTVPEGDDPSYFTASDITVSHGGKSYTIKGEEGEYLDLGVEVSVEEAAFIGLMFAQYGFDPNKATANYDELTIKEDNIIYNYFYEPTNDDYAFISDDFDERSVFVIEGPGVVKGVEGNGRIIFYEDEYWESDKIEEDKPFGMRQYFLVHESDTQGSQKEFHTYNQIYPEGVKVVTGGTASDIDYTLVYDGQEYELDISGMFFEGYETDSKFYNDVALALDLTTKGMTDEQVQAAVVAEIVKNKDAFIKAEADNISELEESNKKRALTRKPLKTKVISQDELAAMRVAYGLSWELLNFLLDEFAFPAIDDMCKEEYTASQPTGKNEDVTGSTGSFDEDLPDGCEYLDPDCADQFQATAIPSADSYDFSFAVGACTEDIEYELYVKREDGNNPLRMEEGTVFKGVVCDFSMPDRTGLAPYTYTIPCIKANGVEHCFG